MAVINGFWVKKMSEFDFLRREQSIALKLKRLYLSYGYSEYKLTSFEEYSLYADNKNFLTDREIITFNMSGKIYALRPDVTLSVVKNSKDGQTSRVFYDEKVYRKKTGAFKEMNQLGAELVGNVDAVSEADMVKMIKNTLDVISPKNVLVLSHMGIIVKAVELLGLNRAEKKYVLNLLSNKNSHDFLAFVGKKNLSADCVDAFRQLIDLPQNIPDAIANLKALSPILGTQNETDELKLLIELVGENNLAIDFSVVGDDGYYNGLIFKGYVEGVPKAVVYGGRYDKLLERMGKCGGAIGFAVYIGELSKYLQDSVNEPDTAIIYSDESKITALNLAEKLRKSGKRVVLSHEELSGFKGEILRAEADE